MSHCYKHQCSRAWLDWLVLLKKRDLPDKTRAWLPHLQMLGYRQELRRNYTLL